MSQAIAIPQEKSTSLLGLVPAYLFHHERPECSRTQARGKYSLRQCNVPDEVPVYVAGHFEMILEVIEGLHDDGSSWAC